ncbi:hypothetical protein BDZ45DRAFT_770379 [Acephala macrosclerotiorum]|nr:hypothetical protein BDZ45DRAFT_770379 [Acephala macrosclerotiorum]
MAKKQSSAVPFIKSILLQVAVHKVKELPLPKDHPGKDKEESPKEDQNCSICVEHLFGPQSRGEGEDEHAVRTVCGHPFGEDCLFPVASGGFYLSQLQRGHSAYQRKQELNAWYAAAGNARDVIWAHQIIGHDPREEAWEAEQEALSNFLNAQDLSLAHQGPQA